jgi:uncharacterized protein YrrD
MKKTQQIIGLPVIEISSGNQLGEVAGIVVNPDQGIVECLLLDRKNWYGEMRALPYSSVQGVGEFAITVLSGSDVSPVSKSPELLSILDRNIQVLKAGVMSRLGRYIGTISEYLVDDKSGKIKGCEVVTEEGDDFIIPGEKVLTYGSKFLIIEDGYENYLVKELTETGSDSAVKSHFARSSQPAAAGEKNQASSDPVEIFEARQRKYLAGKKAAKSITGTGGQVIVEQGDVITEEMIEKALAMDKYIELTMNVTE